MQQKKRLIYAVPRLPYRGSYFNGIQSQVDAFCRYFKKDFEIINIPFSFLNFSYIKKKLINLSPAELNHLFLTANDYGLSAAQIKDIKSADLIHFWHPEFAGLFLKQNYIVSCYGVELYPEAIKYNGSNFFRLVFQKALFIQTICNATYKLLLNSFPELNSSLDKVRVIYPFFEMKRFYYPSVQPKKRNSQPVIGTLSRLIPEKNIQNIIQALGILRNSGIKFRFLLAGDGPLSGYAVKELQKTNIKFKYFRYLPDSKKPDFYRQLDVFVLPAQPIVNEEGIGVSYLEAAASGVPFVTSSKDTKVEHSNLPGVYANYSSPLDIAEKIKSVLNHMHFYKSKCYAWVKKYDINYAAKKYHELYCKSLSN